MLDVVTLCCTEPLKALGKWLGELFVEPVTCLWFFTKNIKTLRDEAQVLDSATKGLQLQADEAKDNLQVTDPEVVTWIKMSNTIQGEASRILDEASTVESHHSKVVGRSFISWKAKGMTGRLKSLRDQKKFGVIAHSPAPAKRIVPRGKTFECESRNKIEEEIMATLRDGKVNMIGICGMGGLGKTTMAKMLMNTALEENIFEEVVMVVVGQKVDNSKIQDEISSSLRLKQKVDISKIQDEISSSLRLKLSDEKTEPARVQKLHARLSDTKRTLLVMDDIWGKLPLQSIGIPHDSKWCTILFTSRNHDDLQRMEVGKIFRMEVLSEDEAWSFFREKAGSCVDDSELNPIAKDVARECGGFPINLAAVAVVLKDKRIHRWRDTLNRLKISVPDSVDYDKESYNPLKLSYENLVSNEAQSSYQQQKNKEAQSIFLLCCLFPKGADIPLEYLTKFCIGLRIFKEHITSKEHATDKMCTLTDFLKDRSLLLESEKKDCVRMHDVVRDVCTSIAKEEGYIGKDGCTWISSSHLVGEGNVLLSGSSCPNVRLLFLDSTFDDSLGFKFDDAFVEGMSELNVLWMENYRSLTTLPFPTQSLGKLNTLILDSCENLKTISVVGEMVNLEILICRDCNGIQKLPSEMKRLYRLKVLDLSGCYYLQSIGRGIISNLVRLEELKMLWSFNKWEAEDSEEREHASIIELEELTYLACLEIDIRDPSLAAQNMPRLSKKMIDRFIIRTAIDHFPSESGKAMNLHLEAETHLGDWIGMRFLRVSESLRLVGAGANNVDLDNIHQNIRWLELGYCDSVKNVVTTSDGDDATVFPLIDCLELTYLPKLQEICDGPISSTSFQNLKELKICYCDSLRNLVQLSMASGKDCLPQLETLQVKGCKMMEQVFLSNSEEVITKAFPKLKEMELYELPNLTSFYRGIESIELPLLKNLNIVECPKMKGIIIGLVAAPNLKFFGLDKYQIHTTEDLNGELQQHYLPYKQKVSFDHSLRVLEINSNPMYDHKVLPSISNSLEELTISEYEGSMSIFTLSMAANLVSLRKLFIEDCDEMIKVIEDELQQESILVFPKLEKLHLKKLPKLVTFCVSKCEVELPSLRKVEICRCPNYMDHFGLGFVATPTLEAFTTDLTTYVGVGLDVAFNGVKRLKIRENENPFDNHKISVSLFSGLEKLIFFDFKGSVSLFPSSAVENLESLKVLVISFSDEILTTIIEDDEKVVSGGEVRNVVFPKLEELSLNRLPNLVSFCEWKCDVKFPSLTKVEIRECPNMESFSMGFVAAPYLKTVQFDEEEIDATKDLNEVLYEYYVARQHQEGISFCNRALQINRNPFCGHQIPSWLINGLEELTINECVGSRSLFILSMAANLVSLRKLFISNCDEMIKVIEDEQQHQRILLFPKLEVLQLYGLPKLVSFCDSKCELPLLREVEIFRCPTVRNFSLRLVATPHLEAFTTDLTTYAGVGVNVAFNSLKRLKFIDNENPFDHHEISISLFKGLERLIFCNYKGSASLFSSSAVGSLINLKVFVIQKSDEIVKVIEDEEEKAVSGGDVRNVVVFPKLEELRLYRVTNLVSFCEWKCDVQLPSLTKLVIQRCPNMESFSMGFVAAPYLKTVQLDEEEIDATKDLNGVLYKYHLALQRQEGISFRNRELQINRNPFCCHEIPSWLSNRLEELTINECVGSRSLFTVSMAANLVSLRKLFIANSDEMIKVIEDEQYQHQRILLFPKLVELQLDGLPKLVSFCDSNCEVELPLLREVEIFRCPTMLNFSLRLEPTPHLEAFTTDLTTYAGVGVDVAFNSLKRLKFIENENPFDHHIISISLFKGLERLTFSYYKGSASLFSSSAVESLINLKVLVIQISDEIVKVIEDEEEKLESGGEVRNVVFPKLEELSLGWLPDLVRFCELKCVVELPSLAKLDIYECPNMEDFSMGSVDAPNLKTVLIDDEEIDATEDLNGTLQQHYLARQQKENEVEENDEIEENDED